MSEDKMDEIKLALDETPELVIKLSAVVSAIGDKVNDYVGVGQQCEVEGCTGIIEEEYTGTSCTCFNNPPCGHCTRDRRYCPECGWEADN